LRSFRPVVIFEYAQIGWHGSHTSLESARDWLSSLGYRLFVVTHSRLVPLGQAPFAGCFNLLAVPGASLDQKEMIDAFK
ncbi:MAG: hypothetical protein HYZ90_04990, partial [Candidatus Omnitrophica bacterium]|nr:hypothetical protein [Candidatus Omnitrophota bacterium]